MFLKVDANLLWTLLNIALLVWLAKRYLFGPLRTVISARQQHIEEQLKSASARQAEAQEAKAQADAWVADAHRQAGRIVDSARDRGDEAYDQIVASARRQARHISEEMRVKLAHEEAAARERIKDDTADLALSIASKMVERQWTADDDRRMVDHFLERDR